MTAMHDGAVFFGGYERFLFKYDIRRVAATEAAADSTPGQLSLVKTACHAAHAGPVKCVASQGSCVFSGGSGDILRVYNAQTGLEIDSLSVPDAGSVTALSLSSPNSGDEARLLIHGCTDGSIHFWQRQKSQWVHRKRKAFHKEAVNSVDIHSTGKMAFTVSRDRSLVLWDALAHKRAFSCKLSVEAGSVHFHQHLPEVTTTISHIARTGDVGVVLLAETCDEWKQMADIQSLCFWRRSHFLTAADDGAVRVWDERRAEMVMEIPDAHQSRIKAIDTLHHNLLATGASDGELKIWDLRKTKTSCSATPLACEATEARITCLVCVPVKTVQERRLKRVKPEEE